ncbi:MAG: FmdB family zinc ribbon protein [bacterium]
MPFYRFQCAECCEEFSRRLSVSERDSTVACPSCESTRTDRKVSSFSTGNSGGGAKPG